jgi:hypothetical protein
MALGHWPPSELPTYCRADHGILNKSSTFLHRESPGRVEEVALIAGHAKWLGPGSNRRHMDFQSIALPTELPNQKSSGCPIDRVPNRTFCVFHCQFDATPRRAGKRFAFGPRIDGEIGLILDPGQAHNIESGVVAVGKTTAECDPRIGA